MGNHEPNFIEPIKATVLTDAKGIILSLNSEAELLYGYEESEVKGKLVSQLIFDSNEYSSISEAIEIAGEFTGIILQHKKNKSPFLSYIRVTIGVDKESEIEQHHFQTLDTYPLDIKSSMYFQIVHNALDVIYTIDVVGKITYVNPRINELIGFTSVELIGKQINDIIDDDWKDFIRNHYLSIYKLKIGESRLEFKVKRKDGKSVWVEQTILTKFHPNKPDTIIGYEGVVRNIDDRKGMEIRIKENERHLRDIFNNSSELIVLTDVHGRLIFVNKSWIRAMKVSKKDSMHKVFLDFIEPSARKKCWDFFTKLREGKFAPELLGQFSLISTSGDTIMVQSSVSMNEKHGEPESIQFFMRNLSESRKAILKIEKSEKNFQQIVSTISDVFYLFDLNEEKIEFVSKNFKQVFGLDSKEFLLDHVSIKKIVHQEDLAKFDNLNYNSSKGIVGEIEYRIFKNNELHWIHERTFPVSNDKGQITGVSGIIEDITKKKNQTSLIDKQQLENQKSVDLAKSIQMASLTNKDSIGEYFRYNFLYFVSTGDLSGLFYKVDEITNQAQDKVKVLILGESIGSGISSSMLSILTSSIISDSINNQSISSPASALKTVQNQFNSMFKSSEEVLLNHGLSLGFATINSEIGILSFSGANQNLYIKRAGEVIECIGDQEQLLGKAKEEFQFKISQVQLEDNDQVFMFNSGVFEQLGGPLNKAIGKSNVLEKLASISEKNVRQNGAKIQKQLMDWKGKNKLNSDVCILAVQYKSN
jgi:PAS domain S-box-containing protein